jgi:hypothetical protein
MYKCDAYFCRLLCANVACISASCYVQMWRVLLPAVMYSKSYIIVDLEVVDEEDAEAGVDEILRELMEAKGVPEEVTIHYSTQN